MSGEQHVPFTAWPLRCHILTLPELQGVRPRIVGVVYRLGRNAAVCERCWITEYGRQPATGRVRVLR